MNGEDCGALDAELGEDIGEEEEAAGEVPEIGSKHKGIMLGSKNKASGEEEHGRGSGTKGGWT